MINGKPIITRSARNTMKVASKTEHEKTKQKAIYYKYVVDDGNVIAHNPDDGAVKLAIKLLRLVKEI